MRILVAEDEKNLNRILTEALTDEGYSVDPCFDGQEAWDALACAEYDVLVLDIMMPRMDGLTLVRKLRESGCTTPVLFLTSRDSVEDKVEGLETGADPDAICDALLKVYPGAKVVLTLGGDGSRFQSCDGRSFTCGIYPVQVADTTAAGDTFTGYFLSEMLRHGDAAQALRIASAAAGLAVSRKGAEPSIPLMDEVAAIV